MFYLKDVKKEKFDPKEFDDRFVKQRDNEPHDDTDFIAQPFIPTIKRRKDNLHAMDLGKDRVKNIIKLYSQEKRKKKIGFEGKLR